MYVKTLSRFGFDIVHGCPMQCVGCPMSTRREKLEYADPKIWGKCLSNVDVKKVEIFRLFNFSDPLLHKRLPEFVEQVGRQKWKRGSVEISTTGNFYDRDVLKDAMSLKVVTGLYVSADGNGTPEEYERLRPPSKWDKLMHFLNDVPRYANVHLGMRIICPDKSDRKRWENVIPKPWKPIFRKWKDMPQAKEKHWHGKVRNGLCHFVSHEKGYRLYVDADGTVVGCCQHPRAFVVGDLRNQTYSQIMKSAARKQILAKLKYHRKDMEICGQCEV